MLSMQRKMSVTLSTYRHRLRVIQVSPCTGTFGVSHSEPLQSLAPALGLYRFENRQSHFRLNRIQIQPRKPLQPVHRESACVRHVVDISTDLAQKSAQPAMIGIEILGGFMIERPWVIAAAFLVCGSMAAQAEISDGVVRVGVLNDTSGIFQDTNGPGSIEAAKMAAEDFAASNPNIKVEIVSGDHQNKPDVGAAVTRHWMDVDKVDAIVDVPNSAVGFAVANLARGTHLTFLASSTASSDLTGKDCSPNTVQWVTDTWSIAHSVAATLQQGGDTWFFVTVNYALGQAIERDASAFIEANGGKVLGSVKHPLGTADFSSFLLQAQSSKAKVIGLANAGGDTINAVKQAAEFGLREQGQTLVAFLAFINDVHAMGLQTAQGLVVYEAFYWDMNDETRAWSKRFGARMGKMPSANQAAVYSATLAYLKAVAATGSDDAKDVVPQMKKQPFHDPLFGEVSIRPDGRTLHAMYLFEVKKPEESKAPYDYYRLKATIPADKAFRPLHEGNCPMIKP
jgi:branched-chain amino acid transport system substrate-binding protein